MLRYDYQFSSLIRMISYLMQVQPVIHVSNQKFSKQTFSLIIITERFYAKQKTNTTAKCTAATSIIVNFSNRKEKQRKIKVITIIKIQKAASSISTTCLIHKFRRINFTNRSRKSRSMKKIMLINQNMPSWSMGSFRGGI